MRITLFLGFFCLFQALSPLRGQENTGDDQTMPQALALFIAGNVSECEAIISSSVSSETWSSLTGLLIRSKNLIYLGAYAKEQDKLTVAQSIGGNAAQLLDAAVAILPANDVSNTVLQLKLRASLEETLLGNSEQAEQLRAQAAALEPPPVEEPPSPPEEE